MILDYLSTEAEQEQLVLTLDGQEEIQPGRVNQLVLRAFSSRPACRSPASRSR